MRNVTVKSIHGQTDIDIGDIGMSLQDGETVLLTDDQAEIALRNPNIVDTATGRNPNYICKGCDKTTYTTALLERHKIGHGQGPHTSTRIGKDIYCEDCLPRAQAQSQPVPSEVALVTHDATVED